MKNKKGFIYVETIITVVILITTLVFLYSSYSNVVIAERKRLYHDDIAYIYKTKHIADVLKKSIDEEKFNYAVNNKYETMYVYMFNVDSPIFKDKENGVGQENDLINEVRKLYNINQMLYIKISDIPIIKDCIKDEGSYDKCTKTLEFMETHSYSYLKDYLKTLDVPTDSKDSYQGHDAILISLIYETKSGDGPRDENEIINIGQGQYSECINDAIDNYYSSDPSMTLEEKVKLYKADQNLSFNMHCENAYYISWVYF